MSPLRGPASSVPRPMLTTRLREQGRRVRQEGFRRADALLAIRVQGGVQLGLILTLEPLAERGGDDGAQRR